MLKLSPRRMKNHNAPLTSRLPISKRILITLLVLISVFVFSTNRLVDYNENTFSFVRVETPGNFHWQECIPSVENVECGSIVSVKSCRIQIMYSDFCFRVPKDYFNPDAGVATIALAKYKAKKSPRKGSVFVNPGTITVQARSSSDF